MNEIIPIFPLNLVVFPSSKYPLHIFEEKYKVMIKNCLETQTGFGIISIINDKVSKIGCYVEIDQILKVYDNQGKDIVVKGKERFYLLKSWQNEKGYLTALVEPYPDDLIEVDQQIYVELQSKFEKVISRANFNLNDSFWKNFFSAGSKAFKIAEKSGLSIEQAQELLTLQDENKRMLFLIDHFEKLEKYISNTDVYKKVIIGDGFLN